MRIAYVCYWDAFARDGVTEKIAGQTAVWRGRGHEATVFCLTRAPTAAGEPILDARLFRFGTPRERVGATVRLYREVAAYAPDLVYLRYDLFTPPARPLLRRFPSAVEVNTNDRAEMRFRRPAARLYNALNRRLTLGAADGIVAVSSQLAGLHRALGKPTTVIANGVDLPAVPPIARREPEGGPQLVFLGGRPAAWHGIDKVSLLARSLPDWTFHLVGVSLEHLGFGAPDNVRLYARMPRSDYSGLLLEADAALGSLALHRLGVNEASPLKLREYLAHGLPSVIAYEDTDFRDTTPWFLHRLPNIERNTLDGTGGIRAFVESVRGRRVAPEEIAHLGWEHKEATRLAFFEELVSRRAMSAASAPARARTR